MNSPDVAPEPADRDHEAGRGQTHGSGEQRDEVHQSDHGHDHGAGHVHQSVGDHDHGNGRDHLDHEGAQPYGPGADHGRGHGGDHPHDHAHDRGHGPFAWLQGFLPFLHGHSHSEATIDVAMETSDRGLWALKISLVILGVTSLFQLVIAIASGSVGLLADTIHNFGDALTALPLGLAFLLGRRAATRRYTYGYGRVEDLAGAAIVVIIFASALVAAYETYQKLVHPHVIDHLGWVIAAALVGFLGNEAVAELRIRVGGEIGSAALVADGQHARVDGFTSLAVLVGALGVLAGFPLADPIVGLLITVAILFIVRDTTVAMWRRLMDAVDPEIVDGIERAAAAVPGVESVATVRVRWLGHRLEAEVPIMVDEDMSTRASHAVAEEVRHALFHAQPRLAEVVIHVDPCGHGGPDPHDVTAHHVR